MVKEPAGNPAELASHAEVRPSREDRCGECGDPVGDEWVSYRQKPGDPENLIQHFGGVVRTGLVEPQPDMPKPRIRDFRYSEDLGVFFHSWCAPRGDLPEKVQEEISKLLAQALVAHFEKSIALWVEGSELRSPDGER